MQIGRVYFNPLNDTHNFYNINLTDCEFNTDSEGFVENHFTQSAENKISECCRLNGVERRIFENELRTRTLNTLMSVVIA